jgi:integrase
MKSGERLTQKAVNELPPPDVKRRIADHEVKGLFLRVLPSGAKAYVLRYTQASRRGEVTIGDATAITLAAARKKAIDLSGDIAVRDVDPVQAKKDKREAARRDQRATLQGIMDEYLNDSDRRKRPKTMEGERHFITRFLLPHFGDRAFADFRRAEIVAFIEKVGAESGPISANRAHATLRQILSFAVRRGLIDANPALSIPRVFPEGSRERILSPQELAILWKYLESIRLGQSAGMTPPVSIALQFCLLTLQRSGEVVGIRRDEVQWEDKVWIIPADRMKGKRPHAVPLSALALERLRDAFAISRTDIAFPGRDGRVPLEQKRLSRAMARACAQLNIPSAGPHDLRRTGRTMLTSERIGVSYETAERVIAHLVGSAVSRVYDRNQYLGEKRAAVETWARELARVVA